MCSYTIKYPEHMEPLMMVHAEVRPLPVFSSTVISPGLLLHTYQSYRLYQATFLFSCTISISKLIASAVTLVSARLLLLSASTSSDSFLVTDLPVR